MPTIEFPSMSVRGWSLVGEVAVVVLNLFVGFAVGELVGQAVVGISFRPGPVYRFRGRIFDRPFLRIRIRLRFFRRFHLSSHTRIRGGCALLRLAMLWAVLGATIDQPARPAILDRVESGFNPHELLYAALREARAGRAEGGIPVGAAIFTRDGRLVGAGHNRRVQGGDPSAHGETDAFRNAGRQRSYRDLIMVTTLAPCWYCSGLVRQFGFRTLIVGESRTFHGGLEWLRSLGVEVIDLDSQECVDLMAGFIREIPTSGTRISVSHAGKERSAKIRLANRGRSWAMG